MRQARARRGLAIAVAVALHAVVLTGLALGPRVTLPVELPTMQVTLAPPLHRPPPPLVPPKPRSPTHRALATLAPSDVAPRPAAPPATAIDERWRVAPLSDEEQVRRALRLRQRCVDGERLSDWERSKCPAAKPLQAGEPSFAAVGGEKAGAFAQAAEDKARQRRYRNTTSDKTYPGLHCLFGRC